MPGLRKEELAVLAGLSPDHYGRLEQGRQHTVTDDVLDAQRICSTSPRPLRGGDGLCLTYRPGPTPGCSD